MIPRHEDGRLHVGALFGEASDHCTDECRTGTVCFEHMTERLKEVADILREKELQLSELQKKLVVGGMPVPGLICVAEAPFVKSLQEFRDLELERDRMNRLLSEQQKVVDAAIVWRAGDDPECAVKLAVAVDVYKKTAPERPKCGSCGIDAKDHDEDTCRKERTPSEKAVCGLTIPMSNYTCILEFGHLGGCAIKREVEIETVVCDPCGCPHPPPVCRSGIEVLKDDRKRKCEGCGGDAHPGIKCSHFVAGAVGAECDHDPEHNPVTGRTFCEKCGITL